MKNLAITLACFLSAFALSSCDSKTEAYLNDLTSEMNKIGDALEAVNEADAEDREARCDEALTTIEEVGERLKELQTGAKDIPKPSEERQKAYEEETAVISKRVETLIQEIIEKDPAAGIKLTSKIVIVMAEVQKGNP